MRLPRRYLPLILVVLAAMTRPPELDGEPTRKFPRARFPEAGTYTASQFFPLVKKVAGLPVRATSKKVASKPVEISLELAGQRAAMDELTVLLAAHGVYLHKHVRGSEKILVASGSRAWRPRRTPMHTRAFTVSPRRYTTALRQVEELLRTLNRAVKEPKPLSVLLPVEATGRLIVRSPSKDALEKVARLIESIETERLAKEPATGLFAFRPANFPGALLKRRLRGFLDEAEWRQLHVVIPRGPNVMWIRTNPTLWPKVRHILTLADTPSVRMWRGEPPIKRLDARRRPTTRAEKRRETLRNAEKR